MNLEGTGGKSNEKELKKFHEKLSISLFNKFFSIQNEAISQIHEWDMLDFVGESNIDSLTQAEAKLKLFAKNHNPNLNIIGLQMEINKNMLLINGESEWELDSNLKMLDPEKFMDAISNLPTEYINQNNEGLLLYSLDNIFKKEIEDFYEKGEFSDVLMDLKNYSKELNLQLVRLSQDKRLTHREDVAFFLGNYEQAFKEGYVRELCAIYGVNFLGQESDDSQTFYNSRFTNNDGLEIEEDWNTQDIIWEMGERRDTNSKILDNIDPKNANVPMVREIISKIKKELQAYSDVLKFIKTSSLKTMFSNEIEKTKIQLEDKISKLEKSAS